jgi:[ribosomal protein S5]-alanine N-acetyltransferase
LGNRENVTERLIVMIDTKRLLLRPFKQDDFDLIFQLYSNERIMRYMPGNVMDREEAQRHLEQIIAEWSYVPQNAFEMAIILKEIKEKIGRARVHLDHEQNEAMIGWLLLEPYWGHGYATEITGALLDFCFHTLKVHRVTALCHPENIGSWKAMEKCKMRREAYRIQSRKYSHNGIVTWEDELEYAILSAEYLDNKMYDMNSMSV